MSVQLRSVDKADLIELHRLQRAVEVADGIPLVTPVQEFEEWSDDPHVALERDTRVAIAGQSIAGFGRVKYRPSHGQLARAYLQGAVHPSLRGRGIGRELLAWQIERARQLLADAPCHQPRFIRTHVYEFETGAIALYERAGLSPVRYFEELLCPLDPDEQAVEVPGIELVPWSDVDSERLRQLFNQSFQDMWGWTPLDPSGWQHMLSTYGYRQDLSWVAVQEDRPVGLCLNGHFAEDEALSGRREGWIRQLCVAPDHRNQGIASALISRSRRSFRAHGFTHAILGADSDSPTGAHRLYRRLGFRTLHRMVQHQLEVPRKRG